MEPATSWFLVRFLSAVPQRELLHILFDSTFSFLGNPEGNSRVSFTEDYLQGCDEARAGGGCVGQKPCGETLRSRGRAPAGVDAQGQRGGRVRSLVMFWEEPLHASNVELYNLW